MPFTGKEAKICVVKLDLIRQKLQKELGELQIYSNCINQIYQEAPEKDEKGVVKRDKNQNPYMIGIKPRDSLTNQPITDNRRNEIWQIQHPDMKKFIQKHSKL